MVLHTTDINTYTYKTLGTEITNTVLKR